MSKMLVLGASGFIGLHVALALKGKGFEVVAGGDRPGRGGAVRLRFDGSTPTSRGCGRRRPGRRCWPACRRW